MTDHFVHSGHVCIVFELCSFNLYDVLKKGGFQGLPLALVRKFAVQILHALAFLSKSEIGIIHCDLKPENILLKESKKSTIRLIDFGSSCFANQKPFTYIQSRFYRAPEILLGHPYTNAIDMWSLGCILVELFTGDAVFPGINEHDQLCHIFSVLGLPPTSYLSNTPKDRLSRYFIKIDRGIITNPVNYRLLTHANFKSRSTSLAEMIRAKPNRAGVTEEMRFIDLIEKMITYNVNERLTPQEALLHPFFHSMVDVGVNTDLTMFPQKPQQR